MSGHGQDATFQLIPIHHFHIAPSSLEQPRTIHTVAAKMIENKEKMASGMASALLWPRSETEAPSIRGTDYRRHDQRTRGRAEVLEKALI